MNSNKSQLNTSIHMTCLCMIIIVHVMMESYFMCITDNHIYVFYCVYSVVCVLHVNVRDQL